MGTREGWLIQAVNKLRPLFEPDYKVPEVKVGVGFPSKGGLSKNRVLGVCWAKDAAADKIAQIYVNPTVADIGGVQGVLAILAHELVHACGIKGHGKEFKQCGKKIGLTGKMSQSEAGPDLLLYFSEMEKELGPFPHAPLIPSNIIAQVKPDKCRILKCSCQECGYTVRVSKKWLDVCIPNCPACNKEMYVEKKN